MSLYDDYQAQKNLNKNCDFINELNSLNLKFDDNDDSYSSGSGILVEDDHNIFNKIIGIIIIIFTII